MCRALRCLVLLTAVSLGAAPAHAQGPIREAVKKAQFEQSDTPGPKSIRVIFSGFTAEDASKECGLDVERLKGAIQSVVGGLTVAYAVKADADIELQLQTVREFDVCVTLMQLGLSAEGTSTLPFTNVRCPQGTVYRGAYWRERQPKCHARHSRGGG